MIMTVKEIIALVLVFGTLSALILGGGAMMARDHDKFMVECAADGNSDFECKAMWQGIAQ